MLSSSGLLVLRLRQSIVCSAVHLSTDTSPTTFTELASMWRARRLSVRRPVCRNTCPLLQTVNNAVDVRLFVQGQNPQTVAGSTALIEHFRIVAVPAESSDQDGDFATTPPRRAASLAGTAKHTVHIG